MNNKISYTKPSISELEIGYVEDAIRHGWGNKCYEYINKFETLFSQHLGVKYCIATSSATGALHMGLHALGIGQQDEVILADINWVATVAPITYLHAIPVFVDVDPQTWCIEPEKVELAITDKTKAIIVTHLYGNLCQLDKLKEIAHRHGIALIEDSAEAIGSEFDGKKAGSIADFGVFSFHGTKTITTGEGGMFVTNDESLYNKVLTLSNHGRSDGTKKQFWPDVIGYKYKMSNVEAAIGCAQVERIDFLIQEKRRVFSSYYDKLKHLPARMNPETKGQINGYWMPTIVFDREVEFDRERTINELVAQGIDARVFFWPLSSLDMFDDKLDNTVSYSICERGLNLPSYVGMEEQDIQRVCNLLIKSVFDNDELIIRAQ